MLFLNADEVQQALMTVFDGKTGEPTAIMDGGVLTAMRTGAVCGVATDYLARSDSEVVANIGAGRQGKSLLEAVCNVRPIKKAYVSDPIPEAAQAFATEMSDQLGIPIETTDTAGEAVVQADIVCTATSSTKPAFAAEDIRPGTHINAIGSYCLDHHEIPAELGELAADQKPGRENPDEITLFKSVGLPIQDLAAANCALQCAKKLDLGTQIA